MALKWFRIRFDPAEIDLQKDFFKHFFDKFSIDKEPEELVLYQSHPSLYIDYYISCYNSSETLILDTFKKFNIVKTSEPDLTMLSSIFEKSEKLD